MTIKLKEIKTLKKKLHSNEILLELGLNEKLILTDEYLIDTYSERAIYKNSEIWSISSLSYKSKYLIIALNKQEIIKLIDTQTLEEKIITPTFHKYQEKIISSKYGNYFAVYGCDIEFDLDNDSSSPIDSEEGMYSIKIYDINTLELVGFIREKHIQYNSSFTEDIYFSPDNKSLVTLSSNGFSIYDIKTGKKLKFILDDNRIEKVLYSNDGKRIITVYAGDYDNFINIYDVDSGELTKKIRVDDFGLKTHQRDDTGEYYLVEGEEWEPWNTLAVYLTPNDKYLILGTSDGITFIDIEEIKIVKYISSARTGIFACSQDGNYIVFEENSGINYEPVLKLYEIIYE